jgi:hypothetical protein
MTSMLTMSRRILGPRSKQSQRARIPAAFLWARIRCGYLGQYEARRRRTRDHTLPPFNAAISMITASGT